LIHSLERSHHYPCLPSWGRTAGVELHEQSGSLGRKGFVRKFRR
jgi:hypothetical protein